MEVSSYSRLVVGDSHMHDTRWLHCKCCSSPVKLLNKVADCTPETSFETFACWIIASDKVSMAAKEGSYQDQVSSGSSIPRTVHRKKEKEQRRRGQT